MEACPATLRLELESLVPHAAALWERLGGIPVRPVPLSTAVRKCSAPLVLPYIRRMEKEFTVFYCVAVHLSLETIPLSETEVQRCGPEHHRPDLSLL